MASAFGTATGRNITFVNLDPADYRTQLEADHPTSADDIDGIYQEVRVGTMALQSGDVERITGNAPRSIEDFSVANVDAINSAISTASTG